MESYTLGLFHGESARQCIKLSLSRQHIQLLALTWCKTKRKLFVKHGPFPKHIWIGLTLTFDILTWLSIGIIYSSSIIYLPSLKLLGAKRSWVISCIRRYGRPTDMCKVIFSSFFKRGHKYRYGSSTHQGLSTCTYQVRRFLGKAFFLSYPSHKDIYAQHDVWPLTYWPEYQ